jgi:hypothetical protein
MKPLRTAWGANPGKLISPRPKNPARGLLRESPAFARAFLSSCSKRVDQPGITKFRSTTSGRLFSCGSSSGTAWLSGSWVARISAIASSEKAITYRRVRVRGRFLLDRARRRAVALLLPSGAGDTRAHRTGPDLAWRSLRRDANFALIATRCHRLRSVRLIPRAGFARQATIRLSASAASPRPASSSS